MDHNIEDSSNGFRCFEKQSKLQDIGSKANKLFVVSAAISLFIVALIALCTRAPERIEGEGALKNFNRHFGLNITERDADDLKAIQINKSLASVFIRILTKNGRKWVSENMPNLYAKGSEVGGMCIWTGVASMNVPWWDGASFQETWIATQEAGTSKNGHITVTISQNISGTEIIHIWGYWNRRH
jgi:hypothetical protein